MKKPYVVLGGGIVGLCIAREISSRKLGPVILIDKEERYGMHASTKNSGVIHSAVGQHSGSLKAEVCLNGSRMLREYAKANGIPLDECGTLIVAKNRNERKNLEELLSRGEKVGVPRLRIIDKKELNYREPEVFGHSALYSPTGAIIDSRALIDSLVEETRLLGVDHYMGYKVLDIMNGKIITNEGDLDFGHLVNCAGLYADDVAHMMGIGREYKMIPFKGNYMKVDVKINSMVYQVPDPKFPFLGVHLTKSTNGEVLAGPTANLSWTGRESYNGEVNLSEMFETIISRNFFRMFASKVFLKEAWRNAGITLLKNSFVKEVNKLLINPIEIKDVSSYRAGIRAQLVDKKGKMVMDFLVKKGGNSTHILNAVSPGMTSAFAFAEYVVDNYIN